MIVELAFIWACGKVGGMLGEKYLSTDQPFWTGMIGETETAAAIVRRGPKYTLHIIEKGEAITVAVGDYPQILAALQSWERFVLDGGTASGWKVQNAVRAAEVAALEAAL